MFNCYTLTLCKVWWTNRKKIKNWRARESQWRCNLQDQKAEREKGAIEMERMLISRNHPSILPMKPAFYMYFFIPHSLSVYKRMFLSAAGLLIQFCRALFFWNFYRQLLSKYQWLASVWRRRACNSDQAPMKWQLSYLADFYIDSMLVVWVQYLGQSRLKAIKEFLLCLRAGI